MPQAGQVYAKVGKVDKVGKRRVRLLKQPLMFAVALCSCVAQGSNSVQLASYCLQHASALVTESESMPTDMPR